MTISARLEQRVKLFTNDDKAAKELIALLNTAGGVAGSIAGVTANTVVVDSDQATDADLLRFATIAEALTWAATNAAGESVTLVLRQRSDGNGHAWNGTIPLGIGPIIMSPQGGATWNDQGYDQNYSPDLDLTGATLAPPATGGEHFLAISGCHIVGQWTQQIPNNADNLYTVLHRCFVGDAVTIDVGTTGGGFSVLYMYGCENSHDYDNIDSNWLIDVVDGGSGGNFEVWLSNCHFTGGSAEGMFGGTMTSASGQIVLGIRSSTLRWRQQADAEQSLLNLRTNTPNLYLDDVDFYIIRRNAAVALVSEDSANLGIGSFRDVRVHLERNSGTSKAFSVFDSGSAFADFDGTETASLEVWATNDTDGLPCAVPPVDAPHGSICHFDATGSYPSLRMVRTGTNLTTAFRWDGPNRAQKWRASTTNGAQTNDLSNPNAGDDDTLRFLDPNGADRLFLVRIRALLSGSTALGDAGEINRDLVVSVSSAGTVVIEDDSGDVAGPSGAVITAAALTVAVVSNATNPGLDLGVNQAGTYGGDVDWAVETTMEEMAA